MQFLRNRWYMVGWSEDIPSVEPVSFPLLGEPIALYRGKDGKVRALDDRCPHKLAPLSVGRVENNDLRCMYHGMLFSEGGQCIEIPTQKTVPSSICVRSYRVEEFENAVWVWAGKPEEGDLSRLPAWIGTNSKEWRPSLPDQMDYEAHAGLIFDNLLDLTHVAYVHRKSFGGDDDAEYNVPDTEKNINLAKPQFDPVPNGFRYQAFVKDAPNPLFLVDEVGPRGDTWVDNLYLAPYHFLINVAVYEAGEIDRAGGQRPDFSLAKLRYFSSQSVTPTGPDTAHYFWTLGTWAKSNADIKMLFDVNRAAFAEDRAMIEAQQKVIARSPGFQQRLVSSDRIGGLYNAFLKRLMDEERAMLQEREPEPA